MTNNSHRNSADAARIAAADSELPNVRERNLRSAQAHDAIATSDEEGAANLKVRQAATAARRALKPEDDDDDFE